MQRESSGVLERVSPRAGRCRPGGDDAEDGRAGVRTRSAPDRPRARRAASARRSGRLRRDGPGAPAMRRRRFRPEHPAGRTGPLARRSAPSARAARNRSGPQTLQRTGLPCALQRLRRLSEQHRRGGEREPETEGQQHTGEQVALHGIEEGLLGVPRGLASGLRLRHAGEEPRQEGESAQGGHASPGGARIHEDPLGGAAQHRAGTLREQPRHQLQQPRADEVRGSGEQQENTGEDQVGLHAVP